MSARNMQRALRSRFKGAATRLAVAFASTVMVLLAASAMADALGTPRLQSPRNKAVVQSLPAFEWGSVGRAASYEFEFSPAQNFSSTVDGFSNNPITITNTALTSDQAIPNGTYYWRVRAVNAKDVPGRWSRIRKLVKSWNTAPKLKSPASRTTVKWPTRPLLLTWTPVAHAANYRLEIGTSPKLSTLVYGPANVQGPQFAFPSTLAPGTYYWAVQPVDAAGNVGKRSAVRAFTWTWPSQTTLSESDVSPDSTYEEPSFSWTAIPGASSYEVQVATDPSYPVNSIILDSQNLVGTSYTAINFFPNHTTLYWRMRAVDPNGDAGSWNYGQPFTETFDQSVPTIQNLHVYDANGNITDGQSTINPVIRWSPVPGASAYQITVAPWVSGCDWNAGSPYVSTIDVPTTAWTPLGSDGNDAWEQSEYGWPSNANDNNNLIYFKGGGTFNECISVIAVRNDSPLTGSTIESAPVILGNNAAPAFSYTQPSPLAGALGEPTDATYSPGIVPPAAGSSPVPAGSTLSTTPVFEWQRIAGADAYYVVIANDEYFDPNSIVSVAYTNTTSWASALPLKDQSSSYWWEVIPVTAYGQPEYDPEDPTAYDPQPFNKSSIPPTPVSPTNGSNVATQPTFSWHSALAAENYTLEISADPTFASPIQDITTDNTSYTSTSTLPSGKKLYWRVRANDVVNNLNWSATETFTHNLPAPNVLHSPRAGSTIPLLSWGAVTGAIGYNLQITTAGGSSQVPVDTPYMTPAEFLTPGISHLQIQSVFPGGLTSAFTKVATYNRTLPSPGGIRATKHGARILVTWKADPLAKTYYIQLSTTTDFGGPIANDTTMNTAWVPQISAADAKLRLYWRLAAVDNEGNVGAFHLGVFNGRHAKAKHSTKKHKSKKKRKT